MATERDDTPGAHEDADTPPTDPTHDSAQAEVAKVHGATETASEDAAEAPIGAADADDEASLAIPTLGGEPVAETDDALDDDSMPDNGIAETAISDDEIASTLADLAEAEPDGEAESETLDDTVDTGLGEDADAEADAEDWAAVAPLNLLDEDGELSPEAFAPFEEAALIALAERLEGETEARHVTVLGQSAEGAALLSLGVDIEAITAPLLRVWTCPSVLEDVAQAA